VPVFGCAYWGRDASVAERDLASLPELGFSWIVVPVSTECMRDDRAGAAAVIAAAARRPMEPCPYWQYPRIQERPRPHPRSEKHCPP
jgi:hypothetical protein